MLWFSTLCVPFSTYILQAANYSFASPSLTDSVNKVVTSLRSLIAFWLLTFCSLLHFTYFHIHFYLRPSHIKTLLRRNLLRNLWMLSICVNDTWLDLLVLTSEASIFLMSRNHQLCLSWSEADINYLWDKSHDNKNVPWLQRFVLEISRMK